VKHVARAGTIRCAIWVCAVSHTCGSLCCRAQRLRSGLFYLFFLSCVFVFLVSFAFSLVAFSASAKLPSDYLFGSGLLRPFPCMFALFLLVLAHSERPFPVRNASLVAHVAWLAVIPITLIKPCILE